MFYFSMMQSEKDLTDNKSEHIIITAQKRFGLFGVEKTTMRELAGDMGISKGLLYYYFPDKESLYKAVLEKELSEFLKKIEAEIRDFSNPEEALRRYVSTRLSLFRTQLNISRLRIKSFSELKPIIAESMNRFRKNEAELVSRILETGKEKKIFYIDNIPETVTLLTDLLRGLRITVLKEKEIMVISEKEYSELSEKTLAFIEMFIKSIKYK